MPILIGALFSAIKNAVFIANFDNRATFAESALTIFPGKGIYNDS